VGASLAARAGRGGRQARRAQAISRGRSLSAAERPAVSSPIRPTSCSASSARPADGKQLIFEAVRRFVSEGSTVLDIGAHVGYAALRFGDWVGASGRVVCFEPVPAPTWRSCRANLTVNGFDARTTVVPFAVSDGAGERPFFDGQGANSGMGSFRER